jgi:hypothetical protein
MGASVHNSFYRSRVFPMGQPRMALMPNALPLFPSQTGSYPSHLTSLSSLAPSMPVNVQRAPAPNRSTSANATIAKVLEREYQCQWQGCRDTFTDVFVLWDHIKDVHVPYFTDGTYSCHWGHCNKYSEGMKNRGSLIAHVKSHIPNVYRIPMREDTINRTKENLTLLKEGGSLPPGVSLMPSVHSTIQSVPQFPRVVLPTTMPSMPVPGSRPPTSAEPRAASWMTQLMGAPMHGGLLATGAPVGSSASSFVATSLMNAPSPMLTQEVMGAPLVAALLVRQLATTPAGQLALLPYEEALVWAIIHLPTVSGLISLVLMEMKRPSVDGSMK